MNRFRLQFVSIALAGILLPQSIQANLDIVDIPVNQFIHSADALTAVSNEVIVKLKEGQSIPTTLLDQKLHFGEYTTKVLEDKDTLLIHSEKYNAKTLKEMFHSSLFVQYIQSVSENETHTLFDGFEHGTDSNVTTGIGEKVEDANKTSHHYAPNEIIVTLKKDITIPHNMMEDMFKGFGAYHSHEYKHLDAMHIKSDDMDAEKLIALFKSEKMKAYVESVSLNYEYELTNTSDTSYNKLWAIENTGQDVNGKSGTNDADMDVAEAWEKTKGSNEVVIAVLDTGVDYSHTDLADNMWQGNPNHGYDFAGDDNGNNDANPMPDEPYNENGHYHGTHVAGIIGAVGDNGTGISGVAQNVSIMAVKVFRPAGTGYSNDILEGVNYVLDQIDNGVNVVAVNASYGGGGSQDDAMNSAIKKLGDKGVVFCAAAGNSAKDIDAEPVYPASYNAENIIAIAASDQDDKLASFSNYGKNTVDVAAPGTNILSTYPEDKYAYLNGTSMATPNVAGSIALLASKYPESTVAERKEMILNHVDVKSDLTNKVATNGRVNINEALGEEEEKPNTAPVAKDDSATTAYETAVTVDVLKNDIDADTDALTIKSYTQPAHGTVTKVDGKLKYTPDNGYSGTDTFSYTVTDGEAEDTATVTVTVDEKSNTVPVAKDDSAITAYETAVTVDVVANDSDADGDTLTIKSYTQPVHGTVTKVDGKLKYTPESGYNGTDTFSYTVTDGEAEDTATVTVTVEEDDTPPPADNSAPVAHNDSVTTAYGTAVTVDVVANDSDADGDALTIKSYAQPAHGTVTKVNGKLKYTPDNGYSGTDTFTYTITDGELEDSATVTVTVKAQEDNDSDDDNHSDDTWYDFPDMGGFNFINGFMGNGVRTETTEGSSDETFLGKFTRSNVTTLITSYIPQTQAKLFMNNQFAIVDMHEGNMQLKIDENAAVMPRMPKVEDAVLPENPLPIGTHVEIPETSDVKFSFTMIDNIQF